MRNALPPAPGVWCINQFATQKCHRTQIAINLPSPAPSRTALPLRPRTTARHAAAALFAYPARHLSRHAGGACLTAVCLPVFVSAMFACMSNSHFIEIDKYWLRTSVQSTLDRLRHSQTQSDTVTEGCRRRAHSTCWIFALPDSKLI